MSKERKCPECKGIVKPGCTELVYELPDVKITVKNVAANVCGNCGQSFISGSMAENLNRLVNRVNEDLISFAKKQPNVGKRHKHKEIAIAV